MTIEKRSIRAIALDIKKEWPKVNFAAKPYLKHGINRQNHCRGKPDRVCVFNANHRGMGLKTRV
jgi:hypothetical protein